MSRCHTFEFCDNSRVVTRTVGIFFFLQNLKCDIKRKKCTNVMSQTQSYCRVPYRCSASILVSKLRFARKNPRILIQTVSGKMGLEMVIGIQKENSWRWKLGSLFKWAVWKEICDDHRGFAFRWPFRVSICISSTISRLIFSETGYTGHVYVLFFIVTFCRHIASAPSTWGTHTGVVQ